MKRLNGEDGKMTNSALPKFRSHRATKITHVGSPSSTGQSSLAIEKGRNYENTQIKAEGGLVP